MQNIPIKKGFWFDPHSLERLSGAGAWSRGLLLYRSQQVRQLAIEPRKNHWLLQGEVQGSQPAPYEVSVDMALRPDGQVDDWRSDCSCPVGTDCKHGVALTVKAAYQGLQLLGPALASGAAPAPFRPEQAEALRQATLARAEEKARQEAEAQLLHWMQALDRASGQATRADGQARPEQYLYLLTVVGDATPRLQLEAVVSYPKVSGGWAKPKSIRTPPHPGQTVYDSASEADRQVLQLMRAMPNSDNFYSAYSVSPRVTLAGQAGLIALQQAASTGRLFMNDGRGGPDAAIQWGPSRTLEWHWLEQPGPQATGSGWALRARLSPVGATLCLNSPPLYLDASQGLCGAVHAHGIPEAQLAVLLKAPPLRTSALQKHQVDVVGHLGSLPTLPLPPVLQDFTPLRGVTPTARLHLRLNAAEDVRFMGLIQAELRFDYQGHRGWWAGQGAAVLVDGPQGRVLLQRDTKAELDAITRLFDLGLLATDGGIFGIPGGGPQQDWLHWADNGFAVLREAGFEVTLDDALAHWITHADSLSVRLQPQGDDEPTSPWFELSLGMEIDGHRHNILP